MSPRLLMRPAQGLTLMACLALAGCAEKPPTPVPDGIGANVPCGDLAFGGFPKYAALGANEVRSKRPWPTYFVCRKGEYAMEFDPNVRLPRWTMSRVDPAHWAGKQAKRRNDLRPDPLLPAGVRNTPEHWKGSVYGPLQLVPAAFVDNDEVAISHTFYTSTIAPVDPHLFEASARLNENIRTWAASRGPLVVVSGPIFDSNQAMAWIGTPAPKTKPTDLPKVQGLMAVPSFIFRVVLDPKTGQSTAFVLPNGPLSPQQLSARRVSLTQVEQWAGMTLFPRLDPASAAKIRNPASTNPAFWPLR